MLPNFEWRVKAFFSQCPVAIKEIELMDQGLFDIHTDNQTKFKLPERVIAKNFVYQMIFSDVFGDQGFDGPAYSYANKADYQHVSRDPRYWKKVIEAFFEKYPSFYENSVELIRTAISDGRIIVPSGRFFPFTKELNWRGELDWPRTKILNYPVQGFSADLVQVARRTIWERLPKHPKVLLINTVHDDVELDIDSGPELVYNISILLEKSFQDIPQEFYKRHGTKINVPMSAEVKFGINLNEKNMMKFKKATFEQDYQEYLRRIYAN